MREQRLEQLEAQHREQNRSRPQPHRRRKPTGFGGANFHPLNKKALPA